MELLSRVLPRIISGVLSILQATRLRNDMYEMQNEHELMWTALDDIKRMYKDHPSSEMASKTLKMVSKKYGR
jgi:hypothetical protein